MQRYVLLHYLVLLFQQKVSINNMLCNILLIDLSLNTQKV